MAKKKGRKLEAGDLIRRHLREPDPEEDLEALTRQAATEKLAAATRTAARHGIAEEVLVQLVRREHRATTSKRQKKSGSAGEGSAAQAKADLQRRESTDKNTFIEEGAHSVRGTPQH